MTTRFHVRSLVCLLLLVASGLRLTAQLPLSGSYGIHDPSTVINDGNRYYTFGTGNGISCLSSTDLRAWSTVGSVFATPPAWTTTAVTNFSGSFWAPDVAYFNGVYHVYYSCSNFGTNDSVIGLVTTPSLQNPVWTDQGKVVKSDPSGKTDSTTDYTDYNCIDASIFQDTDGSVWMTFGSFWNGIGLVQIDPATGKRLNNVTTRIAHSNGGSLASQIEGSSIYKHGGYYYLFFNIGACCSGVNSTYNMRVGRSTSITGPYLDKDGVALLNKGGGTTIYESTGRFIGPGHAGIFQENGRYWLSHHYYDGVSNGAPTLGLRELTWSADSWPVVQGDWEASYPFDVDGRDQNGVFNATLVNGASVADSGSRGKVLTLAGTGQHVTLPLSVGNARTFSTWVKWNGGAAWQRIFDFGVSANAYMYLTPTSANGRMRFGIKNGGAEEGVDASVALPQNQWCHVAVSIDGNLGTLYLNGTPVGTDVISIRPWELLVRNLYLGKSQISSDPYFSGSIDDFRVHGRALSGGEIAQLAGTKVGGPSAVAYWNFEEGAADSYVPYSPAASGSYDGSIRDVTGNGNHLSAWDKNWTWYRASVPAIATPATGVANTRSLQNANNFPALSAIGTDLTRWSPTRWTIEATIRPDVVSGYQTIVGRDSYGAYSGNPAVAALYFSVRPGGVLAIAFTDVAGNNWNLDSATNAISVQKWQAIVASSDGKMLRLYRRNLSDGEANYTLLASLDISASKNAAIHLGAGDGVDWDRGVITVGRGLFNGVHTDRFLGFIDDVRLSEAALVPSEFLYRSTPTVAHWNFEQGAANTYVPYAPATPGSYDGSITDVSGNGNHLSAWGANWAWYQSVVPWVRTPITGVANTRSVQNANTVPSLSAIGTSLTTWSPSAWTIEAAIRPDGVSSYQTIVGRDSQGACDGNPLLAALYFSLRPNGVLAISFTDAMHNNWSLESATNAMVSGQWQAVAATCDGQVLRLYRRNITAGALAYTLLGTLDISGSPTPQLSTGAGDSASWDPGVITVGRGLFDGTHTDRFLGYIDDVRLSSTALSSTDLLYSLTQPAAPAGLTATLGDRKITLAWTAVAGATGYRVKRSSISGSSYSTISPDITSTSFLNDPVTAGIPYYYVVTAVRDAVESVPSSEVAATALTATQMWRQNWFGTPSNTGHAADSADPDNDGLNNLLERALGGNPNVANTSILPAVDPVSPLLTIIYTRAKGFTDLAFTVQESSDVSKASWSTATGTETVINQGATENVKFTVAPGNTGRKFLRLQVIQTP